MGKRGIVLLHVLMTAALIAIVSATIMRLAMLRFAVTTRATRNNQELRDDESALALLTTQWNSNNTYCSTVPGVYTCSGGPFPSACDCTCTPLLPNYPTVVATPIGTHNPCTLVITSADLP